MPADQETIRYTGVYGNDDAGAPYRPLGGRLVVPGCARRCARPPEVRGH